MDFAELHSTTFVSWMKNNLNRQASDIVDEILLTYQGHGSRADLMDLVIATKEALTS